MDKKTNRREKLHRYTLGLRKHDGKICDHINRNKLDNRRENLRIVTFTESNMNRASNKTDHKNVYPAISKRNPWRVMVQAYRLLMAKMLERGTVYPLHLGVTEAGDGEDGRIKSAVGIGALLEDGLGDTIRVSLTEAPEAEIPVAQKLVAKYERIS